MGNVIRTVALKSWNFENNKGVCVRERERERNSEHFQCGRLRYEGEKSCQHWYWDDKFNGW